MGKDTDGVAAARARSDSSSVQRHPCYGIPSRSPSRRITSGYGSGTSALNGVEIGVRSGVAVGQRLQEGHELVFF